MRRGLIPLVTAATVSLLIGAPAYAHHGGGAGGASGSGSAAGTGFAHGVEPDAAHGGMRDSNASAEHPSGGAASAAAARKPATEVLAQNTKLASKLQTLLGSDVNLQDAAKGFKNLGQFVAAAHVSQNLNIPFEQLKSKITAGDSLGKAIQQLDPQVSAKTEVKKANQQTKQDLNETTS